MNYGLIIWYREKPDSEIKRYAALIVGIKDCLVLIEKFNKNNVLVEAIIQNEGEID